MAGEPMNYKGADGFTYPETPGTTDWVEVTHYWYRITIASGTNPTWFEGYMKVNFGLEYSPVDPNRVVGIYTTTDFATNLIGTPPGTYQNPDYLYENGWLCFDVDGCNVTNFPGTSNPDFTATEDYNMHGSPAVAAGQIEYLGGLVFTPTFTFVLLDSDPSCFNHGTKILCLNQNFNEEYIPIQDLRKEHHLVKTYLHGYRKIDRLGKGVVVNHPDLWHGCMYKMEKTEENGLIEDLIVTGGHSILVDNVSDEEHQYQVNKIGIQKIDGKQLLLASASPNFVKIEDTDLHAYYQLTPENNGNNDERFGIWANGVLVETPSKNQYMSHKYEDM